MAKKSLFEKMGLVEPVATPIETSSYEVQNDEYEDESSSLAVDAEDGENLIQSTYEESEMSDLDHSIFKVEELIGTLPKEMTNEVKKNSVLGILQSFGLSQFEVINDGIARIKVLNSSKALKEEKYTQQIEDRNKQIEDLKQQIADMEKMNANDRDTLSQDSNLFDKEMIRITGLVDFIKDKED